MNSREIDDSAFMSRHRYPIFLDIQELPVTVVGGGQVARRKVRRLVSAGALVTVISPDVHEHIQSLADSGTITLLSKRWSDEDMHGARLIVAATDDRAVNASVAKLAAKHQIWSNVADDPEASGFILPSIVDRGSVLVAVSSGGHSPVLTRLLSARINAFLPQSYRELGTLAGRYRDLIKEKIRDAASRKRFWERLIDGRMSELILQGRKRDAEAVLVRALAHHDAHEAHGEVFLVGAGPGDPDLLTFRALRLMQQADIVFYDRLVSASIMALINPDATQIYVGKQRSDHAVPQESINEQLVKHALDGKRVLRLKGGDPYIFGRGGEEIATLAQHDIPFQVVPGITAASGCATYAGIPLTHRDYAQACLFVAGHLKDGSVDLNWNALVQRQQTVVIYMGLVGLPIICTELIAHGMNADMPIALISQGTQAEQQVLTGTISTLPEKVAASSVQPPTLIIIGEVVRLRAQLAWFEPEAEV